MTEIIRVEGLRFKYPHEDRYIVDGVSFHVKQGEWLSIVGHNGSGKSTTVRLIDGLLPAEEGKIWIAGQELTEETLWTLRSKIGMVFQNPDNQFVGATVEDDVAFGLENQGLSPQEMAERVTEALSLVGMLGFKDREPARLSGGQKQRVAIAGIMAMRPEIIILDEATSMLDPEGRLALVHLIKTIKDQYGLTVLSITHDLDEVALSDRVLVMQEGRVKTSTNPRALFEEGASLTDLGLDKPFTSQLMEKMAVANLPISGTYLSEEELEDVLWELIYKK